jgi:hypothetical protein
MKRLFSIALFVVVILFPAPVAAQAVPRQPTMASVAVRIRTLVNEETGLGYMGCGTILKSGNIVTAAHVVEGAIRVLIISADGSVRMGASWRKLGDTDVAIIVLETRFKQRGAEMHLGPIIGVVRVESTGYWGQGQRDGRSFSFSGWMYPKGEVLEGMETLGGPYWPVSVPSGSGQSGSGLFYKGRLIGVLTGGPSRGNGKGYNYWSILPKVLAHQKV